MPAAIIAYLAGPDVFAPDAPQRFARMQAVCVKHGITPLTPVDTAPPQHLRGAELAAFIRLANCDLIRRADCVIANISPFRGPSMDPGTAYEIGFAEALGKPVYLWSESTETLAERTAGLKGDDPVPERDADGWLIENFGLAENLMICAGGKPVAGDFEAAALAGKGNGAG